MRYAFIPFYGSYAMLIIAVYYIGIFISFYLIFMQ